MTEHKMTTREMNEIVAKVRAQERERAPGLMAARADCDNFKSVDVRSGGPVNDLRDVVPSTILDVQSYVFEELGDTGATLCADKFVLLYNLYSDVKRLDARGHTTQSLRYEVEWKRKPIECELGVCENYKFLMNRDLETELKSLVYVEGLSKTSRLNKQQLCAIDANQADQLINVFKSASGGSCKMTRLIKGFLIYLDLIEHGDQEMDLMVPMVTYNVRELIAHSTRGDTAYVYDSMVNSSEHIVFLYLMSSGYPNRYMRCNDNVMIPPDGEKVFVVSASCEHGSKDVTLSADHVLMSLMTYCEDMSCGHEMFSAYLLACFLRENRYLGNIVLPSVLSKVDLVGPTAIRRLDNHITKIFTDIDCAKMIGRLTNSMLFMYLKDLITSCNNVTLPGHNYESRLNSLLHYNEFRLTRALNINYSLLFLQCLDNTQWLHNLTMDDVDHISDISAFEGFYSLSETKTGFTGGVIEAFKTGIKDNLPYEFFEDAVMYSNTTTLRRELEIGGVHYSELLDGNYSVEHMGILNRERREIKRPKIVKHIGAPKTIETSRLHRKEATTSRTFSSKKSPEDKSEKFKPYDDSYVEEDATSEQRRKERVEKTKEERFLSKARNWRSALKWVTFCDGNVLSHLDHGNVFHGVMYDEGMGAGIASDIIKQCGRENIIKVKPEYSYFNNTDYGGQIINVKCDGTMEGFLKSFAVAYDDEGYGAVCMPEVGTGVWKFDQRKLWEAVDAIAKRPIHVVRWDGSTYKLRLVENEFDKDNESESEGESQTEEEEPESEPEQKEEEPKVEESDVRTEEDIVKEKGIKDWRENLSTSELAAMENRVSKLLEEKEPIRRLSKWDLERVKAEEEADKRRKQAEADSAKQIREKLDEMLNETAVADAQATIRIIEDNPATVFAGKSPNEIKESMKKLKSVKLQNYTNKERETNEALARYVEARMQKTSVSKVPANKWETLKTDEDKTAYLMNKYKTTLDRKFSKDKKWLEVKKGGKELLDAQVATCTSLGLKADSLEVQSLDDYVRFNLAPKSYKGEIRTDFNYVAALSNSKYQEKLKREYGVDEGEWKVINTFAKNGFVGYGREDCLSRMVRAHDIIREVFGGINLTCDAWKEPNLWVFKPLIKYIPKQSPSSFNNFTINKKICEALSYIENSGECLCDRTKIKNVILREGIEARDVLEIAMRINK